MFVEKLSLFGFKSFNQKVSLDFGSGISGVIGPNGCGKSNIVDAIRWVLGEQSTKQLRGAKMEDVIFNGTRDEKPLSLAEVSLTLNNERGRLPIDYNTVTVGRRLYRSGTSEYTINKQPVRLKDVRELFLDTGMGSHAYSVIERQMVDNILSDTTGHRRFLFEEAAGIMKYKTRKKEALTKLEATERDLLRVNDIITEVERQVASLKRQVGKARRYRNLTQEIRGIDLAWSQLQRRSWLEEIAALEAGHRDTARTAEAGEAEVARLEAELQKLHLAVLEEERRLSEARESLAQVDDEIGEHNSRILVLRERLDATRQRIREAQEHQVRLTDRMERNVVSTGEVGERLQELALREGTERERLEAGETGLMGAESRVRERRTETSRKMRETAGLRDERIRAEADVTAAGDRIQDLESRAAGLEERVTAAVVRMEEVAVRLTGAREAVAEARGREEDLRARELTLEESRLDLETRVESLRVDLAGRREDEAAARSRLQTLENLRDRYEGFAPGVRALMLDDQRDAAVLGTLADLVQVPGEWVEALEPALSTAWQYVVVRDTATARRLLEQLRADSLGFAALVPLDRVPTAIRPDDGLIRASEVVGTGDETRDLVRYLLGDLALTEDLDEALRLVGEGRVGRAVTRNGQFVDAAVLAGGQGGPAGAELLERQESLDRCRREIETLAETLGVLTAREAELAAERDEWTREAEALAEDLSAGRAARTAAEKEEAALVQEARHAEEARRGLEEERASIARRVAELTAEREGLARRLVEIGAEEETSARALTSDEEALAFAETERERVLEEVHGMRMLWARLEGELKDARSTDERLRVEHQDLTSERDRTVRDEQESRERVTEIEQDLEDLAQKVEELHGERDERQTVVSQREREKSEVSAREQQDGDALREVRRRAAQARQSTHETELKLSGVRGELKHLEERLRDEYDVSTEDLDRVEVGELPEDAPAQLAEMKDRLKRIGPVNLLAVEEYEEKRERFEFMSTQRDDLVEAKDSLMKTITQINTTASKMFIETFAEVQANFQKTFQVLFQGGECLLSLVGDDPLEADIDVMARPRGKRPQGIHQLSSGERALTAIALLFAIYLVKPSPFCILDEVDAPLDDANIDRFVNMVKEFSHRTQFIVITHNKKTMEAADCLYGVTMQRPGVSSVVSVRLDGLDSDQAEARALAGRSRPANGRGNGGSNGGNGGDPEPEPEGPSTPESIIAQ